MSLPAAIYVRISRDREGAGLGVERQELDCRALADREGLTVVQVYSDNDISASNRSKKQRPGYAAMLAAVDRGEVSTVIAYSNSRLTRRPREWIDLIDRAQRGRLQIRTVKSGSHDLTTADGRAVALTVAIWDAAEAERTSERLASQKAQAASSGKYRGGPRPFGYEQDGVTVRESEAKVIRDATKAVLAGRTLASIARELREQGLTGTRGKPITYNNLRDMLLRPRNAGILARGLPNRNATTNNHTRPYEEVGPAAWPAVVPEEEWRALVKLLTDGDRLTAPVTEKRWIGSGIYRCGVMVTGEDGVQRPCGGALRVAPHGGTAQRPFERRYLYRCTTSAHLTISQKETDEYIREVIANLVRDPIVVGLMVPGDAHLTADRERRSMLATRLRQIEDDYTEGRIPATLWQKSTAKVEADIAEVDARMAASLSRTASSGILRAADPSQAFLDAPLDVQRAVLASLISVEVLPAPKRGGAWTSDRLRITSTGA